MDSDCTRSPTAPWRGPRSGTGTARERRIGEARRLTVPASSFGGDPSFRGVGMQRGVRLASDCPRVELWGRPIVPRCRYAGEEFARRPTVPASSFGGDPSFRGVGMPARSSPGVRLSPRRALGETHRSAVSVCRRGVRPASDCPRVELWGRPIVPRCRYAGEELARGPTVPASSFGGDPSFRGVGMPARSSPSVRLPPPPASLSSLGNFGPFHAHGESLWFPTIHEEARKVSS